MVSGYFFKLFDRRYMQGRVGRTEGFSALSIIDFCNSNAIYYGYPKRRMPRCDHSDLRSNWKNDGIRPWNS
jgi:hypothetical protein